MYKFVIPDVRIVAVVFVTDEQPTEPDVPIAVATPKRAKDGKAIGNSTVPVLPAPPGDQLWRSIYPPWPPLTRGERQLLLPVTTTT